MSDIENRKDNPPPRPMMPDTALRRDFTPKELLAMKIKELHERADALQSLYDLLPERILFPHDIALMRVFRDL